MAGFQNLVPIGKMVCGGLFWAAAGCASIDSGSQIGQPTHHWVRADASVAKYNFHNSRCLGDTQMNVHGARGNSAEFIAYRACMEGEGYELVARSPLASDDRHRN
ncbi:MAG: hypothetical protein F4Y86_07665 [Gammaproteobacteria bacterium]|nr:hypothetical protein [Gammaproteobacteria bacterium]MYB39159.1 hypothetical protein [Gammaproteobacteria bacterium]